MAVHLLQLPGLLDSVAAGHSVMQQLQAQNTQYPQQQLAATATASAMLSASTPGSALSSHTIQGPPVQMPQLGPVWAVGHNSTSMAPVHQPWQQVLPYYGSASAAAFGLSAAAGGAVGGDQAGALQLLLQGNPTGHVLAATAAAAAQGPGALVPAMSSTIQGHASAAMPSAAGDPCKLQQQQAGILGTHPQTVPAHDLMQQLLQQQAQQLLQEQQAQQLLQAQQAQQHLQVQQLQQQLAVTAALASAGAGVASHNIHSQLRTVQVMPPWTPPIDPVFTVGHNRTVNQPPQHWQQQALQQAALQQQQGAFAAFSTQQPPRATGLDAGSASAVPAPMDAELPRLLAEHHTQQQLTQKWQAAQAKKAVRRGPGIPWSCATGEHWSWRALEQLNKPRTEPQQQAAPSPSPPSVPTVPSDDDKAEILGVLMGRVSISARAVLQRKLDSSPAELLGMLAHHPLGPQHSGSSSAAVQMAAEDAELEQLLEDLADEPTSDDVDPSTEEQQDGADADAEADADADADMRLLLPGKRSRRSASDSSTEVELEAP